MALSTRMLWTAILVSVPVLGLSMLVGLTISVVQVITQVQEMSLTFVPKIFTVALTLIVAGPWMLTTVVQFATELIENLPAYL